MYFHYPYFSILNFSLASTRTLGLYETLIRATILEHLRMNNERTILILWGWGWVRGGHASIHQLVNTLSRS